MGRSVEAKLSARLRNTFRAVVDTNCSDSSRHSVATTLARCTTPLRDRRFHREALRTTAPCSVSRPGKCDCKIPDTFFEFPRSCSLEKTHVSGPPPIRGIRKSLLTPQPFLAAVHDNFRQPFLLEKTLTVVRLASIQRYPAATPKRNRTAGRTPAIKVRVEQ